MAFFLTPRFAPAYTGQQCSPWACAPARPSYGYHQIARPPVSSLAPFLSQVDELLGALDLEARREAQLEAHREAQREAHRQRQLRKRAFRAHFVARENNEGYQIDAEIPGFQQENIEIEVTDAHTLRVVGNIAEKVEQARPSGSQSAEAQTTKAVTDSMEGVTLNEPKQERPSSPVHSESGSSKSYQATVEDDFEDLGAETSSIISASSEPSRRSESKGKAKVVEPNKDTTVQQPQHPQPEAPSPSQQEPSDNTFNAAFERTFRFGERIDSANVRASLRNGLLSITVPKAKAPEVRRILIQ